MDVHNCSGQSFGMMFLESNLAVWIKIIEDLISVTIYCMEISRDPFKELLNCYEEPYSNNEKFEITKMLTA